MLTELDQYSTAWTWLTLVVLVGLIPTILFVIDRAATAGSLPDLEQLKEVKRLAAALNESAEELLNEATRAFVSAPGERQALELLIGFTDGAEEFRLLALNPSTSAARIKRAFQELCSLFDLAWQGFPALKAHLSGRERLEQIHQMMEDLKQLFDIKTRVNFDSKGRGLYRAPSEDLPI